ncbi:MAG: TonB-dependent receptor family protein [Hyphomicrobium sp.]
MKRAIPALFVLAIMTDYASAQQTGQTPSAEQPQLPDVEVIQQQQPPAPAAAQAKPKPAAAQAKPKPKPQPEFIEPVEPVEADPTDILENSPYGSPAATGAAERARQSAQTPVNPTQLVPDNLSGFAAAATRLTSDTLEQNKPSNINEALTRVPGVVLITDDAAAHHGGIGVRGSPPRRSRKILVMEDGHANNLALWLDPSVHYWGPIERFEDIEVIRGTIITHGPNNNFGVINARNLSPFGPAESVISGAIGFTRTERGSYNDEIEIECDPGNVNCEAEEDGDTTSKRSRTDLSYRWHAHTRQHADNVGVVASYTGANVQGLWDTEQLRFHDFYGAVGWKGVDSDLVVSSMYARQRDSYDEQNFLGEAELPTGDPDEAEDIAEQVAGFAESQFKLLKHCKSCFAPAAGLNNYNGEIWRGQIVHNAYLDNDTTITSRVYAQHHRRDRYQLNSYESEPDGSAGGAEAIFDGIDGDPSTPELEETVYFGENTMFGRLRTFRHIGAEIRGEWANRSLLGFSQDIQAGIRYEYQDMTNRNFIGDEQEVLNNGDEQGTTIFDRELDANTVSAFLQTNVKVASNFNVVPGIRFEWYDVGRRNRVVAREESEAGGADDLDCAANGQDAGCLSVDGIIQNPDPETESFTNFAALPGVGFAYTGLYRTAIFGGYHRGLTTQVLRNEDFPGKEEIGDNFNLGLRSSAFRGFEFEAVGYYQLIEDYQYGASFSNVSGDRSFGIADEVEVSGVELYGRLNSQPFTGGPWNFFTSANYTYSRGVFKDLSITEEDEDNPGTFETTVFDGNRIPESPLHVAALTLGVEKKTGWRWDASVTWTYRGAFFTDEGNTGFGFGGEVECEGGECEIEEAGEDGEVPSVWLLSARFNMDIGNTGASVFVSGDNLLDELYISDREDGIKPGLGRTIWTGFKYKF